MYKCADDAMEKQIFLHFFTLFFKEYVKVSNLAHGIQQRGTVGYHANLIAVHFWNN